MANMTNGNGSSIVRIGRKGVRKFAFGDDGTPFEVDVVVAFQEWILRDAEFRDDEGMLQDHAMVQYHQAALQFVNELAAEPKDIGGRRGDIVTDICITTAEALDFLARLRECYDEVADFFRPRSRRAPDLHASSGPELRFSVEGPPAADKAN